MPFITFEIDDSKAVGRINVIKQLAGNMRPVFQNVGRVLVNRIRMCFSLGIDPWGTPWQRLRFREGQPLRNTGRLQRSFVARADPNGVTVGTNVRYARTHQFGADIQAKPGKSLVFPGPNGGMVFAKRVRIPPRSFLPIRRPGGNIALPPTWAIDVTRALRRQFELAAAKGDT
jgi:phage gpG-like protein